MLGVWVMLLVTRGDPGLFDLRLEDRLRRVLVSTSSSFSLALWQGRDPFPAEDTGGKEKIWLEDLHFGCDEFGMLLRSLKKGVVGHAMDAYRQVYELGRSPDTRAATQSYPDGLVEGRGQLPNVLDKEVSQRGVPLHTASVVKS